MTLHCALDITFFWAPINIRVIVSTGNSSVCLHLVETNDEIIKHLNFRACVKENLSKSLMRGAIPCHDISVDADR